MFDMDGLLLDTEPIYARAWQSAASELGFELSAQLHRQLIGRTDADSYLILGDAFGSSFRAAEFSELWPRYRDETIASDGIALKPGLLELVSYLDELELPYAIATSTIAEQAELSLRVAGISARFEIRVTGDQVENGKPAPDIYLEAARRLDVAPRRCIALEDSNPGLLAAVAAGMTGIMIPDLDEPTAQARGEAYRVVASLQEAREVMQAHFFARN